MSYIANKERDWHNQRYDNSEHRRSQTKTRYAYAAYSFATNDFERLQFAPNQRVLDIGCGRGVDRARLFGKLNCSYTGIDISDLCIIANKTESEKEGLNAEYYCEDANIMAGLTGKIFDLIIYSGTLHHLDIKETLSAASKLLSRQGKVVMLEPMGTNPALNLFRKLTPKLRTEDEHPLTFSDLKLIKSYFPETTYRLHTLTALLAAPLFMISHPLGSKAGAIASRALGKFDVLLGKIPLLRRLHWIVVISAKPSDSAGIH